MAVVRVGVRLLGKFCRHCGTRATRGDLSVGFPRLGDYPRAAERAPGSGGRTGGRRPRNRMDGPLWRRLRALWFVVPTRTMGEPIVLRPARALAQVGRLLEVTSHLYLFCLDLLFFDQPVDQADGGLEECFQPKR